VRSHIHVIDIESGKSREVLAADRLLEAPNWSPDGEVLIVNGDGKLWELPASGGEIQQIPTGRVTGINNDHGISPDGRTLVISAGHMYLLPFGGGEPRQITTHSPSYYHGWSPDGRTLAYCARRDGNFDIYAIPVGGGEEQRLTSHAAYDDGPDYSPDGQWIYFNSDRSGSWDIWRIPSSGAGENDKHTERVTSDDFEDWFPHPSLDGRWIVFLSYAKGTKGHPPNQNVVIRKLRMRGKQATEITEVVRLFGGQGTINVNSWAPDSKRFAYVSYTLLQP
jgi:Tol biopolymer transport system component